ncbi:hypothetical protein LRP67_18710 [Nocardioides sp. cx-169]|uniref:hypothetical protein n=1 Tax=Nocardioides sp. cx-169 TaxID=2899080 RepID=UPI001E3F917C|nr:hypothetical protein [Nocardioides sp. cx-169]MCD4536126.1 hypothetical protein [Nocardioides sp. cx-169]
MAQSALNGHHVATRSDQVGEVVNDVLDIPVPAVTRVTEVDGDGAFTGVDGEVALAETRQ